MLVLTLYAIYIFRVSSIWSDISQWSNIGVTLQEDMYSYVTVADDQQYKGKGTEVVDA